jgi:(p)ppGpp synthase/HD superfamily hydrolase
VTFIVALAQRLAHEAHAGQTYNGRPYTEHCRQVVCLLAQYGYIDHNILAAGWLHDALEDTNLLPSQIEQFCGPVVLSYVEACTGVGRNRRERNADIAAKLAHFPSAIPIKVADRIANVSSCWENRDSRLFMYHREYRDFRAVVRGHVDRVMLADLDALMGWRDVAGEAK